MAVPKDDFISDKWTDPEPELRLVNGIWVSVPTGTPPSSSVRHDGRKPISLREKRALEEARKAAEESADDAAEAAADSAGEAEASEPAAESE